MTVWRAPGAHHLSARQRRRALSALGAYAVVVGKLIYKHAEPIEIEDRALAHLRMVFMNKLRRGEPFGFSVPSRHGTYRHELWIHPSLSLQFHFTGSRAPMINPRWIDALMESANGPGGLRLVPEPQQ